MRVTRKARSAGSACGGWLGRFAMLAAALLALLPSSATANHSLKELLSTGPSGGNAPLDATFKAASQNGARVFFTTTEALVPADQDTAADVYERANGATTLVSVGQQGGLLDAFFVAASPDGSHVLFRTMDQLLAADTDSTDDLYERAAGTTTLFPSDAAAATSSASDYTVCPPPVPPAPPVPCYSQDGSKLFFTTAKQLVAGDTDSGTDVYERSTGGVSLLSTGPNGGNGPNGNAYEGSTPNGAHVYFISNESLVAADTDNMTDLYERANGATTLISTGPNGGNGPFFSRFAGVTPDGAHVFFVTIESLVASDTDLGCVPPGGGPPGPCQDVYERSGMTTTLASTGPSPSNGPFHADFSGVSNDGARVFFRTGEQLASGDADSAADIYEHSGGTTTLISTGSNPCSGSCSDVTFKGSTPDGSRVWFETKEALESADVDTKTDVYERSGGSTTLVSTGTGVPCCADLSFQGASQDGTRVFFGTSSSSFERFAGGTTQLATNAAFKGSSLDGTRVFLQTSQALVSGDLDAAQDVYALAVVPYQVPQAAPQLNLSLVPVFRQCGTTGNPVDARHAPPFSSSCRPPMSSGTAHIGSQATGSARISAIAGDPFTGADEADVSFNANLTDVHSGSATGPDYNPSAGPDLTLSARWRITDNSNGPAQSSAGTTTDLEFQIPVDCIDTADPALGAGCGVITSANVVMPGAVKESRGTLLQTFRFRVTDSGPNGARGDGDDTLFAQQGLYVP